MARRAMPTWCRRTRRTAAPSSRGRDDRHQFPLAPEDAAECEIVSKKVESTYRSDRCPVWIKVRNPASVAVQRERSEIWNR
jgi:hypothetical protein